MRRIAAVLGVMVACWILLIPPSAGPDEPVHLIRSAGLVRGDWSGTPTEIGPTTREFDVPGWVGGPSPECYWFNSLTPAGCSTSLPAADSDATVLARRAAYPPWAFALPGLGTYAGSQDPAWYLARALGALPSIALLAGAAVVARRRHPLAAAGVVLAITPMAWFTFSVVNPSGPSIAGGVAAWIGLLALHDRVVSPLDASIDSDTDAEAGTGTDAGADLETVADTDVGRERDTGPHPWVDWLFALGWAALVLPRRDGLVWAGLLLGVSILALGLRPVEVWRRLRLGPQIVFGASTAAAVVWLLFQSGVTRLSLAGLLVPPAAVGCRAAWDAADRWRIGRTLAAVAASIAVLAGGLAATGWYRRGGYDGELLRTVVGRTGEDLAEGLGYLGWLDAPLPLSAQYVFWIGLGALAAAAFAARERMWWWLAIWTAGAGIGVSWMSVFAQGSDAATYWQGRYYLPVLVGVPIALAWGAARTGEIGPGARLRIAQVVTAMSLVTVNVGLAAAVRRWGVGIQGSMRPWDWDTYGTPVPVVVALAAHVAASVALWLWATRPQP